MTRSGTPRFMRSMAAIDAATWNALAGDYPFMRHEFLAALVGWRNRTARDQGIGQFKGSGHGVPVITKGIGLAPYTVRTAAGQGPPFGCPEPLESGTCAATGALTQNCHIPGL